MLVPDKTAHTLFVWNEHAVTMNEKIYKLMSLLKYIDDKPKIETRDLNYSFLNNTLQKC